MGQIRPEQSELFSLELRKIDAFNFVNTLASTNINQSTSNLVKIYVTIRFQMSLIICQVVPEGSESLALELENLPYLTLFTL